MSKFSNLTYKLQKGLAKKGIIVFVNKTQFWSDNQQRPINIFIVYETEYDEIRRRRVQHEVMRSSSMADIVMYLGTRYNGLTVSDAVTKAVGNKIDPNKIVMPATDGEAQKRMEEEIIRRNLENV
jgi:hypothetical protein